MPTPRNVASVASLGLLALASLLLAPAPASAVAAGATYEIVDLSGQAYATTGLAFTPGGLKATTPAGLKELPSASIDWYETFYRNIKSGATNVIVFRTGSLLRFEKYELKDGNVVLTVAGGQISLAESLIDFQESVREGAMVKLPEGAGASVQVSRPSGGAWSEEDGGAPAEEAAPTGRRARGSVSSRRRAGLGTPPAATEDTPPEEAAAVMEEAPQMETERPNEEGAQGNPQEGSNFGRSPFPRRGGPLGRDNKEGGSNNGGSPGGTDGQSSGQAVVTISTDYSGTIGGLQVLLQYPPNLQVVEPVTFTGFAGNWLATPNTTVAGQINIGGIAQPGTSISGGEFLRVTFVWTGTPPSRQLFRISQLQASGETSEPLTDFRTTMDVQVSP